MHPKKSAGKIRVQGEGTLIHDSREKARREGERKPLGKASPPNLPNISLFGLVSSYLHPYALYYRKQ